MAHDPFGGWPNGQTGTADPFGEFPFQMPGQQQQQQTPQQQQKHLNAGTPDDPVNSSRPQQQAQPQQHGQQQQQQQQHTLQTNLTNNYAKQFGSHAGGGGGIAGGSGGGGSLAARGVKAGMTSHANPFEGAGLDSGGGGSQAYNSAAGSGFNPAPSFGMTGNFNGMTGVGTAGGGGGGAVLQQPQHAPATFEAQALVPYGQQLQGEGTAETAGGAGAGVVEDLFGVQSGGGDAGAPAGGALVPYGQPFESQQRAGGQQHQHPQAMVPFQPQQQPQPQQQQQQSQQQQPWGQQAGGGGGGLVAASNPFDDLFSDAPVAAPVGGATQMPQQQWQQPQQQQQHQHPQQQGQWAMSGQQQQQQQQQPQWTTQRGGGIAGTPQQTQPQYHPQQHQPFHVQPQQQQQQLQLHQQQHRPVPSGNPFFDAAQGQQQPTQPPQQHQVPGADLFGEDPFGATASGSKVESSLTATDDGFLAAAGRPAPGAGGGADPFDPFDLDSVAAAVPTVDAAATGGGGGGGGRRLSGGSTGSGGDGGRRGRGGRGRGDGGGAAERGGESRRASNGNNLPPSETVDRWAPPARSRSASVPRGTAADREGARGAGARSPDGDPFGSNSGKHGPLPSSSLSRPRSFKETPSQRRGRTSHPGGGFGGGGGGGGDSVVMRTASSGALRGRGRGPQHLHPYGDGGRESGGGGGGDDDTEDEDGGYDSDTMSVMDSDALRAAMGRRERERGGGGVLGSVLETVEYVVEFERARKLGMLLERHDEWPDGREKRSERAIVKMVVDSGPAQTRGVTVGSKVKKVNGDPVEGLTYQQTLDRIKQAPRPLRVHFERGQLAQEDKVGQILFKKTVGVPRSYSAWQRRYFVLGGAVAKAHVLQIYVSKQSYDRMVLAVFENRRINERVKAYKLNNLFKCGPIKMKAFKGHPTPLYFFTVKLPTSRLKQLNFASQTLGDLQLLRASMAKFTST